MPAGDYDVAVFENLFPDADRAGAERSAAADRRRRAPARGACEVVVFTQDPTASLGALPLWHLELLLEVWADRYRELGARAGRRSTCMPFENRGVEVGVTLHHPHGQIYAYPFVPPVPARELAAAARSLRRARHAACCERSDRATRSRTARRVLYDGPARGRVHAGRARATRTRCGSRRAGRVASLADARRRRARADFARALKTVLLKFDGLWSGRFPTSWPSTRRRPTAQPHPEAHLHIEFYPAYRMPGRLKYLAGSEIGAGVFTADTLPEEKAAELRAVEVGA